MKRRKCYRRLFALLLAVCMVLCICPNVYASRIGANRSSTSNRYNSNWVYWSQGASKYSGMRGYGCRMVAQAKLLMETGTVTNRSFNPDTYYEWCKNNGYINSRMQETRFGRGPGAYAQAMGKRVSYDAQIWFQTSNRSRRCTQIMQYIRQGYYVILGSSAHHAYVGRSASLDSGTPVIYDSWTSWSYNTYTTQRYSRYREASFDYFLIFSAGGNVDTSPSLTVKNISNLTASSVQLNASCSYTVKPTEVGIYMGTSSNNLQKMGSDRINHNKNPFDIWYKIYDLNANTRYYYQIYAVVNGNTYWSNVYYFTTKAR